MHPDDWHLTEDVDGFFARAGGFLRSRPALHNMQLTIIETLRTRGAGAYGTEPSVFGWLERAGEVCATLVRAPRRRMNLTPLVPEQVGSLAARLADLGRTLPGVAADHDTAVAFAEAWQRCTGATPTLRARLGLYRLGTLTPPEPFPEGRGRLAGEQDRDQLTLWCREFVADTGGAPIADGGALADPRFAYKRFVFWETPDGTPVSMAGMAPVVAGQVRVDPVYTPARLRGRGYAGAAMVEVSRAALAAGATEVVLFTNLANPTSNALYQRVGYQSVTNFAAYDFSQAAEVS
jgi:GNAT superfamily N-acetyltransferase